MPRVLIATLQDAIYAVLDTTPRREWPLQQIYAAVAKTSVVTEKDGGEWGGQSNLHHRIRSDLAKMKKAGLVELTRPATYRLL